MAIEKRYVSRVDYTVSFAEASIKLGYGKEKMGEMNLRLGEKLIDTLIRLVDKVERRNYFEIYSDDEEGWGRLKASDSLKKDGRVRAGLGFYAGFFHGRVIAGTKDPLVVVSFRGEIIPPPEGYHSAYEQAVIHAVSDHNVLFAEGDLKYDEQYMRDLRQKNSQILDINAKTPDDDQSD
ncbi:hypothetical protein [Pantoea dispersa]|uniref:hypothetical protein n=1 Tax=Pantoea dispersa TaxID=59814 RepID=UPI001BACF4FC|nr:hypothetical protein [Pantoea dispersa]MBS0900158.1 hypothetical protein [Pantoea dispersa]